MTPAIAPDAPTAGMAEEKLNTKCARPAAKPARRCKAPLVRATSWPCTNPSDMKSLQNGRISSVPLTEQCHCQVRLLIKADHAVGRRSYHRHVPLPPRPKADIPMDAQGRPYLNHLCILRHPAPVQLSRALIILGLVSGVLMQDNASQH
jgi:hypothetical protein